MLKLRNLLVSVFTWLKSGKPDQDEDESAEERRIRKVWEELLRDANRHASSPLALRHRR